MNAATPGQADDVPDVFARYQLATFPADLDDFARNETAMRWKHLTGPAEREFWRSLDAAQEARPAPGTVQLDAAVLQGEVRRLSAALERLASEDWLGTQGYDGDELQRRADFARDALDGTAKPEPQPAPELATVDLHRWYAVINQPDGTSKVIGHTGDGLGYYDSAAEWEAKNS